VKWKVVNIEENVLDVGAGATICCMLTLREGDICCMLVLRAGDICCKLMLRATYVGYYRLGKAKHVRL
jgi:hypothetical protein